MLRIIQVCIHLAHDVKDGQYQRIRKLQNDIHSLTDSIYYEFQVVGLLRFLRCPKAYLCTPAAVEGRKIVLPVLFPGDRRMWGIRKLNDCISMVCGVVIGLLLRPNMCIGETHGSFAVVRGVAAVSTNSLIIFDLHGAYPEEIVYANCKRNWAKVLAAELEKDEEKLLNLAEVIIAQSDAMFLHLENKHKKKVLRKILYQCGVDLDKFRFCTKDREEVREELSIGSDALVFVYLGGFHRWQLIDATFEIFSNFVRQNAERRAVLLVLTKEAPDQVMQIAGCHEIPRGSIRVLSVAHSMVSRYLSACDLGFLLREDSVLNRVACPTKLGEYLACGLPVITSMIAQQWSWTNGQNESVCVVDYADPKAASTAVACFLRQIGWRVDEKNKEACRVLAQKSLSQRRDLENLQSLID